MQRNITDILQSYYLATHYDPTWYKAWHTWALANFEVVGVLESQQYNNIEEVPGQELTAHIVSSVTGPWGMNISRACRTDKLQASSVQYH